MAKRNVERIYDVLKETECDVENAKQKLISVMHKLEEVNAIREARSLETIIEKLEKWQNP